MTPRPAISTHNHLLASLPSHDRNRLLANCEPIELAFSEVLCRADELISHVYFPTGSFISVVTPIDGRANLEVGLIGNEGMLGITLLLGVNIVPFYSVVQGAGSALRMTTALFLRELEQSPALETVLKRYLYVSMKQLAQTAACTRFHLLEARLARWLLMTQDRAQSDHLHVTHVFLAYILGVRRVGITKAANSLLKKNLISYQRGDLVIRDRVGLEAASCGCYRADKEIYERILG
ncbi:Crp/Fnr family transcriptional regulator [Crenothrix sp.]|uniref:Crp/Fnr family transcriptional regulator n=1 Tax=Crenothrix sp. TaxID=3100433 RepID=UPI00374D263F